METKKTAIDWLKNTLEFFGIHDRDVLDLLFWYMLALSIAYLILIILALTKELIGY